MDAAAEDLVNILLILEFIFSWARLQTRCPIYNLVSNSVLTG